MKKLNQVVAIEKGVRNRTQKTITELHHACKKGGLFNGHIRTYEPINDDGERFPEDRQSIQMRVPDVLDKAKEALIEQMDIVACKDFGNVNPAARADVVIDGAVLISNAPVPFLLYVEKELVDLQTFILTLPELDESQEWTHDDNTRIWKTAVVKTIKTAKLQEALVLLQPTKEHAGQAKDITVDRTVGYWNQIKHSGSMPLAAKQKLIAKIHRLIDAVKQAREEANMAEVDSIQVGKKVFDWLLG